MPLITTELSSSRGDLLYLLDEADAGPVCKDCRSCLSTGNKVSLLVKTRQAKSYVYVGNNYFLETKAAVADPNSVQVTFNWINLTTVKKDFACILQNGLVSGQTVGVERLADSVQLSLQLQQRDNKQHYVIYVQQNSSEYFALYLRSAEGDNFYILPNNGRLQIFKNYQKITKNVFVFQIGTYRCSNSDGCCPFERLMRRY